MLKNGFAGSTAWRIGSPFIMGRGRNPAQIFDHTGRPAISVALLLLTSINARTRAWK